MPFSKPSKLSEVEIRQNRIKGDIDQLKTQLSRCDGEWNQIAQKVIFRGFVHNAHYHPH